MSDFNEAIEAVQDLKKKAKNRRDMDRLESARDYIMRAITNLESFLAENPALLQPKEENDINFQLADCYGILGGIYRRMALQDTDVESKKEKFISSYQSYYKGDQFERKSSPPNSYNMVNTLISRLFYEPELLTLNVDKSQEQDLFIKELKNAEEAIQLQLRSDRARDIWALADLGLVKILLNAEDPVTCFLGFVNEAPPTYAYTSLLSTLKPLTELNIEAKSNITSAVAFLERRSAA